MAKNSVSQSHQEAIDNLQIRDVFLVSTASVISTEYEPKYLPNAEEIGVQHKHVVDRTAAVSFSSDEEKDVIKLFRVYIELGAKWEYTHEDDSENNKIKSDNESRDPLAKIEACFVAEYQIKNEISKESLEEFALKNASYHIWPYWREYLMNQATRMNLPKAALPMVQFSVNGSEK